MNEFVVPVNDAIEAFGNHLDAYPRTILSSKFGDGKSYFLQKAKEDTKLREEYEFLTIYPVNYQVAGNKDVFEILKRDILVQLMLHEMINGNVKLSKSDAFSWFLQMKCGSLLMDFLPYFAEIGLEKDDCAKVITGINGLKLFKDVKDKFKEFTQKNLKTEDDIIVEFLDKVDSNFIYECDVITKIIQKTIAEYKRTKHKKVVLIVEDMDRIDPAHLFRILNILSAQMDYCYKDSVKPDTSLIGNKFGLDNIVLVVDFKNLKSIYKHFYGVNTDFEGYISKFLSGVPFYYSLEKQKYNYIVNKLTEITGLNGKFIQSVFTKDIMNSKTMRETIHSFELQHCIISDPIVRCDGRIVHLNKSFLKLMAIMKRLKCTDEEIVDWGLKLKDENNSMFVRYILPYMFLFEENENQSLRREICIADKNEKPTLTDLELNQEDGTVKVAARYMRQGNEVEPNFAEYIEAMLNFIV